VRFPQIAVVSVFVTLLAYPLLAQSPNGTINGLVLDPSTRVIAGADILLINDATGVKYSSKTNDDGIYVVPNLPPGPYRLQVSKVGFKTLIKPDIVLNVQDALSINFTLPVGAVFDTMTVQGGAPLVATESAAVSTVIDRNFVESLPLNGRSFNTLLQLTPGVVVAPSGPGAGGSPGQFSVAGQRTDSNNFTVDGISANFGVAPAFPGVGSGTGTEQAFSALGGTSSLVSVEALQEFRIETSSFAAEFGRSPGGQVVLTTRSGTNNLHGGAYEYFRNTVMDANDWFNNAHDPILPRAPEHHNDFGAFLGGPIWKDKTFFFASYEGARLQLPQTEVIQVPSDYARTQASQTLAPFLNAFPRPNGAPTSPTAYIAPFTGSFSSGGTLDAGSVRIDHTINQHLSIFGRYNYAPSATTDRKQTIPNNPVDVTVNTETLTVGLNMLLTNQISNSLRGNYSRQSSASNHVLDSSSGAIPIPPQSLLGALSSGSTYASFETFDTFREYIIGPDAANRTRQFNLVDDFSLTLGTHQLKFGEDYRAIYLDMQPSQNQLWFTATSIPDFLSSGQAGLFARTLQPTQFLARAFSVYGQDTWKATSRLTVTYGLRWELSPAPSPRGTTTLASWTHVSNPSALAIAPTGTPLWSTTYGNFAPRLGIAYSLDEKGRFVVRGGGGVFYDLGVGQASQLGTSFPNYASGFFSGVPLPLASATPYLPALSRQPPYPSGVQGYQPDLGLPRSYQWNVALEKSYGDHQAISVTYLGQAGRDIIRQEALYQPNSKFAGDFLLWTQGAISNYSALQVQYRRPLSTRLQVLLNYSWAHSLDNASNDVVAGLSNAVISGANDYASADTDVKHTLSGAINWAIPSVLHHGLLSYVTEGWSIDGVVVARSGFPFNGLVLFASPDPGGYAESRPDRVPGQTIWIPNPTAGGGKSLNPAAFSVPPTPRQGTEGRNDIPGFGLTQIDLSLARKFAITDRLALQFRADAFNLFNHPNFANPPALVEFGSVYLSSGEMLNQALGGLNPIFQQGGPRSLQLSVRLTF